MNLIAYFNQFENILDAVKQGSMIEVGIVAKNDEGIGTQKLSTDEGKD